MDTHTLKYVYYGLIYSHLQYCISTWGFASKSSLDPLDKIHKRIVRIITDSPYRAHTAPIYKELNILTINDICKLEVAKKMYCFHHQPSLEKNIDLPITSIQKTHHYNTRQSSNNDYFLPRKRTESGKKSFSFIGPKIWQEIPTQLKQSNLSFNVFKKKLKQHFINAY